MNKTQTANNVNQIQENKNKIIRIKAISKKKNLLFLNNDKLQLLRLIAPLLNRKTVNHIVSSGTKVCFCMPQQQQHPWKFSIGKSWQPAQSQTATGQFKKQVHLMKQMAIVDWLEFFFSRLQLNEFYLFLFIFGLII